MHCNVHAPPASIPIRTLVQRTASVFLTRHRESDLIVAYCGHDPNFFIFFIVYIDEVFNILETSPSSNLGYFTHALLTFANINRLLDNQKIQHLL